MKLYLVRHGESALNAQKIHQDSSAELSEHGKAQAAFVAKRFSTIPLELILSSPFARAKQTAEIIGKTIEKEILYSPLFKEIKRPTEIEGKFRDDPEVMAIKTLVRANYHDQDYRYSDEETFFDFKERALQALEYIQSLEKENILVVTHGDFVRMLFSVMIYGEELQPAQYRKVNSGMLLMNTGITVCEYKEAWRLVSWNDSAHLGVD